VWREVRRTGALHLQQSIVAFPDTPPFRHALEQFRDLVTRVGGETLVIQGEPLAAEDAHRLVSAWNEARDAEYSELTAKCAQFLDEIEHEFAIEKFTAAELEEEEAEVEKLERWFERINSRDVHHAAARGPAHEALHVAQAALGRFADAVFAHSQT
jgi:uncharacterized protein YndB with AHSA1/START domain